MNNFILFNKQFVSQLKYLRTDFQKGAPYRLFSNCQCKNQGGKILQWSQQLRKNSPLIINIRQISKVNKNGKSQVKRLISLAKPERWKLLGKYITILIVNFLSKYFFSGAVCFLVISSSVSMAVPFSLGKVLDIIYTSSQDTQNAREKLNNLCMILIGIFLVGAICNFGRIYLMTTSGNFFLICQVNFFAYLYIDRISNDTEAETECIFIDNEARTRMV